MQYGSFTIITAIVWITRNQLLSTVDRTKVGFFFSLPKLMLP